MFLGSVPRDRAVPRSLVVLACLAAGFILARHLHPLPAALWFGIAGLGCVAGALTREHPCRIALALAAVAFGGGWFTARLNQRSPVSLDTQLTGAVSPAIVTVEGLVLATPEITRHERSPLDTPLPRAELARFTLGITSALDAGNQRRPARGKLLVSVPARGPLPRAGQHLRLTGEFAAIPAPLNPGERDRRLWHAQQGVIGSLRASSAPAVLDETGPRSAALALRARMADRAREILLGPLDTPSPDHGRALLGALVLGEDEPALREVRGAFQRLGLLHALSISGFHFMVMVLVALTMLRAATDLGWLEPVLITLLVIAYVVILPFNAPVWRSAMMVLALLIAQALGRRYDTLALLGWCAVLLLLWRPMDLWSIGFQLSFGLVASLLAFGRLVHQRLWGVRLRGTIDQPRGTRAIVADQARQFISANIFCWALATPLVMHHTGVLSILAVPTGLVMVPLIALLLVVGYLVLLVGALIPALAPVASAGAGILADALAEITLRLDQVPAASVATPPVSIAWTAAATILLLFWCLRGRWRSIPAWSLTAAASLWLAAESSLAPRPPLDQQLRVDALAIGDGTCMVVRSGRDAVLWDCGSLRPRIGEYTVPRTLRALGIWRIPTVVITHPNLDHFNALPDLIAPLGIRRVITGEEFLHQARAQPWGAEAYILEKLAEHGVELITVAAGDELAQGALRLRFLSPPPASTWTPDNELSLVAAVSTAGMAQTPEVPFLLTGDIQQRAMGHLLAGYPTLRARVAEAPHHGSARPFALDFLYTVAPAAILQSTGPQRADHPLWNTLRAQTRWHTTATDGASWAAIRRDGAVVTGSFRR